MATHFGQVYEFDAEKEHWIQYVERLEQFFEANSITEAVKKRAILLTCIGPSTYRLLRSLVTPDKPDSKTFKDLVAVLKDHYDPKPSPIVERFKFNSRVRRPGESISTFISELRSLAEHCEYGSSLDDMLRDRLVCGINDTQIQRRLLAKKDLTFQLAREEALGQKVAALNLQTLLKTQESVPELKEAVHTKFPRQSRRCSHKDQKQRAIGVD